MKIEELDDTTESITRNNSDKEMRLIAVWIDAKRALVGAGARILFYLTLLYNVFRNKIQSEFRWWDQIDQVSLFFCYYFDFLGRLAMLVISFFGQLLPFLLFQRYYDYNILELHLMRVENLVYFL